MTDTASPQPPADADPSLWGRLSAGRARAAFGAAYVIAFLITAAAIWLAFAL